MDAGKITGKRRRGFTRSAPTVSVVREETQKLLEEYWSVVVEKMLNRLYDNAAMLGKPEKSTTKE